MAISFNKRENEKKKQQKRQEKQKRKEDRKTAGKTGFEDMIAYVDENGMITSTPPDLQNKEVIDQNQIQISVPRREDEDEIRINKGRVEYFSVSKGYGFIKDATGPDKYFFHKSNAPEDIEEGNIVTFDLEKGNKGMNAVNVTFFEEDETNESEDN